VEVVGRYVIERRIGEGAMADVYRAHDPSIDRVLAIKVLKPEFRQDLSLVGRFLREARAAGVLSHPNIVTIYDVGEADGFPYIAMELLDGVPLDEHLREAGRMPFKAVIAIGAQIAEALNFAHGLGVIHRDIKPSNIMLCDSGRTAKILDFGIARMAEADRSRAEATAARTQFGQVLGTPRYMSPEQAFGLEIDHRSDLFSLGVVLYELTTGQTAFAGTSIATLALQITQRKPEPLGKVVPGCPRGLQHIVDKLIAKQPEKRFASGADVAAALRREQDSLASAQDGRRRLPLQLRLTLVMGVAMGLALLLSIAAVLNRQYKAMEQMALTSGTTVSRFVANNVALRAVENAGLAAAEQDWAPVQAFIASASDDNGIRGIVMVDAGGIVRGATTPGAIGTRYRGAADEARLARDADQIVTTTRDGNFRFVRTILYAGQPFGTLDVVVDNAELEAAAASSRNLLIGLGFALLLAVLAIGYVIGRSIARPVERLRRALNDAAAGNPDIRISHNRTDAFGELFDAYNGLAESIAEVRSASVGTAPISLDATRIGPALDSGAQEDWRRIA
jgi:tRNA A-37 threonylcarbamoyl transferase component Bud32/HAMP domain-containing protein